MSVRGLLGLARQISERAQAHIVSTWRGRVITELAIGASILGWIAIVATNYYPRWDADLWLTSWGDLGYALGTAQVGLAGAVANLARAALIILSGLGYGCLLMRRLRPAAATLLEGGLFAAATGLAALADLVLLVGSIGWLHIEVLWALLALGLGTLGVALVRLLRESQRDRSWARRRPRRWSLLLLPWLSLCAVQLALSSEGLVLPDLQTDAWHYHLGAPKFYLIAGRLIGLHGGDWPNIWLSNMPFTCEMLYTVALGIGDYATGKALHFAAGVLCSLVAFALRSRLLTRFAGVLRELSWLSAAIAPYAPWLIRLWPVASKPTPPRSMKFRGGALLRLRPESRYGTSSSCFSQRSRPLISSIPACRRTRACIRSKVGFPTCTSIGSLLTSTSQLGRAWSSAIALS